MAIRIGKDSIISSMNICNEIIVTAIPSSLTYYMRSHGLCCGLGPCHHLPQYLLCALLTTIDRLHGDVFT